MKKKHRMLREPTREIDWLTTGDTIKGEGLVALLGKKGRRCRCCKAYLAIVTVTFNFPFLILLVTWPFR